MATKKVYKQQAPRKRIENSVFVTSPYNDPTAVMATQTPGQPQRFGAPTVAGTGSIAFKQTEPLFYNKQTPAHATYPWYGYGEVGLNSYYNAPGSYKSINNVPTMGDWAHKTTPYLNLGVQYTNKYNPKIDPYKRLTAKNSVVGFGAEVHSGDSGGGGGFPIFAKPEVTYRIPLKKSSSSGKRPTAYVNGVYGRYEDKKGLDVKAPVGLDIYGNLDAQYEIPFNDIRYNLFDGLHGQNYQRPTAKKYRDATVLPNDFNMGRTRLGTNIGARAQWDNGFSANLNAGAYYNPYNPGSKIIPVINAGVAYRYKDGGWLSEFQDAGETVSVSLPDGTVKVIPKELFDKGNAAGYFIKNDKGEWAINPKLYGEMNDVSNDTIPEKMEVSEMEINDENALKTEEDLETEKWLAESPYNFIKNGYKFYMDPKLKDLTKQGNLETNPDHYGGMSTEIKEQLANQNVNIEELKAERHDKLTKYVQSKFPDASPEEIENKVNQYDSENNGKEGNGLDEFYAQNPDLFRKIQIMNAKSGKEGIKFMSDWAKSPMYNKLTTASVNKDFAENEGMRRYLRMNKNREQRGSENATTAKVRLNQLRRQGLENVKFYTNKLLYGYPRYLTKEIALGETIPSSLASDEYYRKRTKNTSVSPEADLAERRRGIQKTPYTIMENIPNEDGTDYLKDEQGNYIQVPQTYTDESTEDYAFEIPEQPNSIIFADYSSNPSVGVHEVSHSTDFGGQAMPFSDKNLITSSYKSTFNPETDDPMGLKSSPSEVRARLNEVRALGAWDVFNKKARLKDVRRLRRRGKLNQLPEMYDDKTILNLLNTVAQNNPEENEVGYAKDGGWLTKYEKAGKVVFSKDDPVYLKYLKDKEQYQKDLNDYYETLKRYNDNMNFITSYGDAVTNYDKIDANARKEASNLNRYGKGDLFQNIRWMNDGTLVHMQYPHTYIFDPFDPNNNNNVAEYKTPDWYLSEFGDMTPEKLARTWGSTDRSDFKDWRDDELNSYIIDGKTWYAPKRSYMVSEEETDPTSKWSEMYGFDPGGSQQKQNISAINKRLAEPIKPEDVNYEVSILDGSWQKGAYDNYEAGIHTPYRYKSYYLADDLGAGTYNTSVDEKLYQDINTNGLSLSHKRYFDPKTKKYVETVQTYTPEGDVDKTYTIGEEYDGNKFTSRDLDKLIFKAGTKKKKLGGWLTNYK